MDMQLLNPQFHNESVILFVIIFKTGLVYLVHFNF